MAFHIAPLLFHPGILREESNRWRHQGVGFALAPVSSADLAHFFFLAIMAFFLGGLKACVVVGEHQRWMDLHSPQILFLREERALKLVSRQAGLFPNQSAAPLLASNFLYKDLLNDAS